MRLRRICSVQAEVTSYAALHPFTLALTVNKHHHIGLVYVSSDAHTSCHISSLSARMSSSPIWLYIEDDALSTRMPSIYTAVGDLFIEPPPRRHTAYC